ncbi:unnamed protein product [Effrenium voratum]|uniref:Uncharacterized protein n=1 Tax=Effrenium voratum TaxID=2562239 RepID=A0AA36MUS4_9DINO|nr:unnamed protein product [Effrenium voratum]
MAVTAQAIHFAKKAPCAHWHVELQAQDLKPGFVDAGRYRIAAASALAAFSARRQVRCVWRAADAGAAPAPPAPPAAPRGGQRGAKLVPTAITVGIGLFIRFVLPVPAGLSGQAWSILALFVATVAGIVTQPLPAPGVAFCALAVGLLTKTLTFQEGVAAFTDEVLWLVLLAFFFTKGFAKTGLGDRIALSIVRLVGGTTLGLAYGLNLAEGALAAGMPSSAARAAGVFYPLVDSVAKACGSEPEKMKAKNTGGFLVQSSFQATGNSSSLWLYGAAQNLLALRLAAQLGYVVPSPFMTWLKASCVPALVAMALTPLVAFWALTPEVRRTPNAPLEARRKLEEMGPMSRDEVILAGVIAGMLCLWAGSSAFGIPAVHTAVLGLSVLLASGVLSWSDCAEEKGAWTTMTWFAILVSMSAMLNKLGIVKWLAASLSAKISAAGLSGCSAFLVLLVLYTFSHYAFASQVAHLSALYLPFIAMMVETGTPPMVAIFSLAFASNIFGSMTPYSSAQAPVFFGGGYVSQRDWYRLGLIFILFNLIVWVGVGAVWWKAGRHFHRVVHPIYSNE